MSAAPLPIGARVGSRVVLGYAQHCGYEVRATVRCDCGRVDEVSVRSMGRVCQSCARSGNGTRSAQPGRQARVIARSGRPDVVSALAEAGARAPDLWRADTAESVRAVAELADTGVIAALYVQRGGSYYGMPNVDPWDEERDARLYPGPHPVVAHPPCSRWCRLAGLVEARWGHRRGDDGGCFAAALASVRQWGGVLEHPAYSDAWPAFDLPRPPRHGGWVRGLCGGWTCHVEQGRYGHPAKKATWLYAVGCYELPSLRWGSIAGQRSSALVSWCGNRVATGESRPRVGRDAASKTPEEFRTILIEMARSVRREETAHAR